MPSTSSKFGPDLETLKEETESSNRSPTIPELPDPALIEGLETRFGGDEVEGQGQSQVGVVEKEEPSESAERAGTPTPLIQITPASSPSFSASPMTPSVSPITTPTRGGEVDIEEEGSGGGSAPSSPQPQEIHVRNSEKC